MSVQRRIEALEKRLGCLEAEGGRCHVLCLLGDGETLGEAKKRMPSLPWKTVKYIVLEETEGKVQNVESVSGTVSTAQARQRS